MIAGGVSVTLAALAGTPHCLGMCGGLAVAGSARGGALPYHLGRIGVYAVLGAVAGAIGGAIPGPPWVVTAVSAVLLVGFALALAGFLPEPRIPGMVALSRVAGSFARRSGPLAGLGFGAVNGLLPCGLLYATLAVPAASGSAPIGAALMALFGAVTSLPLAAAAYGLRPMLDWPPARIAVAAAALFVGLAGLAHRGVPSGDPGAPTCHQAR